jgi:hypothetical protein
MHSNDGDGLIRDWELAYDRNEDGSGVCGDTHAMRECKSFP